MSPISYEQIAVEIASIAGVPATDILRDSRLIEDIGLDSLGLHELIVVLGEHGVSVPVDLDGDGWQNATVEDLLFVSGGGHRGG
jgi:acyl carrier protein